MSSGWQIAGAYVTGAVALGWNIWNKWHDRQVFACAVSWEPDATSPLVPGEFKLSPPTEYHEFAVVSVRNIGNATLYDVEVVVSPAKGFQAVIPKRGSLIAGDTVEVRDVTAGQELVAPRVDDPPGRFRVDVTYARRPGAKPRKLVGQLSVGRGAEVHLEANRKLLRDRLADRLRSTPPPDRVRY